MVIVINGLHEFAAFIKIIRGEDANVDEIVKLTHDLNHASSKLIEAEKKQEKK